PRRTPAASCRSGRERSCADSTCASSIRSTCSRRRTYHEVVALIRTGDLPQLAGCKLRRAVERSGSVVAPGNQLFRVDGHSLDQHARCLKAADGSLRHCNPSLVELLESLWVGGDLAQALPLLAIEPGDSGCSLNGFL